MKLQGKINLCLIFILIFIVLLNGVIASIIMNGIIYQLNSSIFSIILEKAFTAVTKIYLQLYYAGHITIDSDINQAQADIIDELKNIRFGESGNIFIFTNDKQVVYFNDLPRGETLNFDFVEKIINNKKEQGEINFIFKDDSYYCKFIKFANWKWTICFSIKEAEMFAQRNNFLILISIIFMLILIVAIVFVSLILNKVILVPLKNLTVKVKDIAEGEGDLTKKLVIAKKDEIGKVANYFNDFINYLRNIIVKLKDIGNKTKDIGTSLQESSNQVSSAGEEISISVDSVLERTTRLTNEMEKSSSSITEINKFIENVVKLIEVQSSSVNESSSSIEEIISSIGNISRITEEKKRFADGLAKFGKDSEDEMEMMVKSIEEISNSASVIAEMMDIINNVAGQTDLLAMNAAIEAAHAGEFGKGFSVVAEEIRKLAETSGSNAKNISNSLRSIIEKINSTASITKNTRLTINKIIDGIIDVSNSMDEMMNGMRELGSGSNQIIEALGNLVKITEEVRGSSQEMNNRTGNIEESIKNVLLLVKANKVAITETAAGVNQISRSISQLSDLSKSNTNNIKALDDIITKFKTEE